MDEEVNGQRFTCAGSVGMPFNGGSKRVHWYARA